MKQKLILTGLNIFIITALLSIGAFAQRSGLGGRQWKLTYLNGKAVGERKAYIELDTDQKRFTGNAGCNRMFGSFASEKGSLKFSAAGTTRMMCADEKTTKLEIGFLKALNQAARYRVRGNILRIYSGKRTILKFTAPYMQNGGEGQAAPVRLEDKKWVLEAVEGKAISKVETEAFIVFDPAKKSAGGNTSCNVFGGNYEIKGDTIKFSQTISTMRACIEDDRMNIERSFLGGLQDIDRYAIRKGKLLLFQGDRLRLTFAGKEKK